jgi:hypothetical protein
MRKELERIEIPGEHEARERSWPVVQAAFAERQPQQPRRSWKPVATIALALVIAAGLLSPPGRAVLDGVREVVGVEKAQPALFSLPAPGRLLVASDSGAWVVDEDGSKRRLGSYREASWSPFGRFVVASRRNELVALTPGGEVRWTLARPDVRFPRWGGTKTDTRIAYLSRGALRVVGGDGRGDRLLDRLADEQAPAWQPGLGHRLAYARRDGTIRIVDTDTGAVLDRDAPRSLVEAAPTLSPNGRWRVVGWADADQLVFTRLGRPRQIRAVSNVSAQFRSRSFPTISGWCCAP